MNNKKKIHSKMVSLEFNDIDTDQIIPKEFLTCLSRFGLSQHLFSHWRYPNGEPDPNFILNTEAVRGAKILVAGNNFGCGSSREHAVWALQEFGFEVVISTGFADIFLENCIQNGLLAILINDAQYRELVAICNDKSYVTIDVERNFISYGEDVLIAYEMGKKQKISYLDGLDHLEELVSLKSEIDEFEKNRKQSIPWV